MRKYLLLTLLVLVFAFSFCTQEKDVVIKICHTSDIHGNYFPYDFIRNTEQKGSLARVSTFLKEKRNEYGNHLLLLDGGDVLQGQPSVYYYNFVDTLSTHLCAGMMNYLGYEAAVMGNHDIEAGRSVYDRWVNQCNFPVLGANIIETEKGTPYLPPYHVFTKGGIKIAVLGMITEAIPAWLPENLWKGFHFEEIPATAAKWVPYIKEKESPDIIAALIHSGVSGIELTGYQENEGMELALTVPGLDVVFCGHDHSRYCEKVVNNVGDSVLIIDPAAGGSYISDVTIRIKKSGKKLLHKEISGQLINIATIEPDKQFMDDFADAYQTTMDYVNEEIGVFTNTIDAREAFFGPSAFNDLLHRLQLELTGADISLVAPLSQTTFIDSGKVYMRDMFNLYRYENLLYTMELTGKEIVGAMEHFYGLWVNQMKSPDDHVLLIEPIGNSERYKFVNPSFAFDTTAGIYYTVDVTKPAGQRIHVLHMADGTPFNMDKVYKVAVNSYQGSGGSGILTEGAGISKKDLAKRIVYSTDKDLRYYLAEQIKKQKVLHPEPLYQWKFIPEKWTEGALKRDYKLLFGK